MSKKSYILDPLWITQGSGKLDAELLKYVLLAANKKFRNNLESGDISGFNEIVFHALNLNNLVVEGTVFNFNLKPVWDNPRLIEIRESLRKMYQIPKDILEVFKSANYLFINLLIDHIDKTLDILKSCEVYTMNDGVHMEKEIFFIIHYKNSNGYEVWRLKFDSRIKMGSRLEYIKSAVMGGEDEIDKLDLDSDKRLSKLDSKKNTIFVILKKKKSSSTDTANAVSSMVSFTREIGIELKFNPNIMEELLDILMEYQVLPFTLKV